MGEQESNSVSSGKSKLTYVVIIVFFAVVILFGARDKIENLIGSDKVSGGYVTSAETKKIITEFIEENPELIIRSLQKFQQKHIEKQMQERNDSLKKGHKKLMSLQNSIVLGNPESDVKVIKFFDYKCGHCKSAHNNVDKLLKDKVDFTLILKPLPLLGSDSERAARISTAAYLISPSKYAKFHEKLFTTHSLNQNNLKRLASESGYDADVLINKMNSKEVVDILNENKEAAGMIGLQGVPGFVIGEEFIRGSIPMEDLKAKINAQRKGKS
ncbi:MAG: DsbA family protein [Rickettsiales bacterium]